MRFQRLAAVLTSSSTQAAVTPSTAGEQVTCPSKLAHPPAGPVRPPVRPHMMRYR